MARPKLRHPAAAPAPRRSSDCRCCARRQGPEGGIYIKAVGMRKELGERAGVADVGAKCRAPLRGMKEGPPVTRAMEATT
eukprot:6202744-Pleurochrysis_carterae.AAC.5